MKKAFLPLLLLALVLVPYSYAANDPGHDSLYILRGGDNVSGVFNFSNAVYVGTPTQPGQATTKAYVDSTVATNSLWTNSSGDATYTKGNVGIGNTSPTRQLDIQGGVRIKQVSQTQGLRLENNETTDNAEIYMGQDDQLEVDTPRFFTLFDGLEHLTLSPGSTVFYSGDLQFRSQGIANRGSTSGDDTHLTLTSNGDLELDQGRVIVNQQGSSGDDNGGITVNISSADQDTAVKSVLQTEGTDGGVGEKHLELITDGSVVGSIDGQGNLDVRGNTVVTGATSIGGTPQVTNSDPKFNIYHRPDINSNDNNIQALQIDVKGTATTNDGNATFGQLINTEVNGSGDLTGTFRNVVGEVGQTQYTGTGATNEIFGAYHLAATHGGTNQNTVGIRAVGANYGATITTLDGLRVENAFVGGSTTTASTIRSKAPLVISGNPTNMYGINIEDHSGIGTTNSYNIYSQGTSSVNMFEGAIVADSLNSTEICLNGDCRTAFTNASGSTGWTSDGSTTSTSQNVSVDGNTLYVDSSTNTVGIGTNTPGRNLEVSGTAEFGGEVFYGSDGGAGRTTISRNGGGIFPESRFLFKTYDGYEFHSWKGGVFGLESGLKLSIGSGASTNHALNVDGNTNITETIYYGGNLTGTGADFAERFQAENPKKLRPGDVVCMNTEKLVEHCTEENSKGFIGVVSNDPTIIGNSDEPNSVVVGLIGRIYTQVDGPFEQFSSLYTGKDGKATPEQVGTRIGKALDACDEDSCTVEVLVGVN